MANNYVFWVILLSIIGILAGLTLTSSAHSASKAKLFAGKSAIIASLALMSGLAIFELRELQADGVSSLLQPSGKVSNAFSLKPKHLETEPEPSAHPPKPGYSEIHSASDLDSIRNNLDGKFVLMSDISLGDWGNWSPIGEASAFAGEFDGNGHAISGMKISRSLSQGTTVGLFAFVKGGKITNLKLENVNNAYLS